jgi:hypothetical protein
MSRIARWCRFSVGALGMSAGLLLGATNSVRAQPAVQFSAPTVGSEPNRVLPAVQFGSPCGIGTGRPTLGAQFSSPYVDLPNAHVAGTPAVSVFPTNTLVFSAPGAAVATVPAIRVPILQAAVADTPAILVLPDFNQFGQPRMANVTPLPAIPLIQGPLGPAALPPIRTVEAAPAAVLLFQEPAVLTGPAPQTLPVAPPASLMFQEPSIPPEAAPPVLPQQPAGPPPASQWFQAPAGPSVDDPDSPVTPWMTVPVPDMPSARPSAWLTHPAVSVIPRPGFFAVPPTGPGSYSLLDLLTGKEREKPPTFGYPRSAIMINGNFDTDWRYVDQPGYQPDLLEKLHRIHLGDNWLFATGGEFRDRWANEINSRLNGKDNDYDLTRLRIYGDLWYKDIFRIYVEFVSAQSFWQDLPPLIIDRNYADLLNAFVDVKVFEDGAGVPWYVRGGRQQLLFGSQRLISPLDWANTMRTFDGIRAFRHSETLDIDAFWSRVVIPSASRFDTSDPQQNFAGAWMEYRPSKTRAFDLYYLYLANNDRYNPVTKTPVPVGQLPEAPYTVHTFGYRYAGNLERNPNILFDSENMLQFGRSSFTNSDIVAGQSTTGVGYNFAQAPMNPTVWTYFDYATGSKNINAGQQFSTFNQLYPFGHYYFGWLDYVGRDNIEDLNFHLYLYPTKWITFNAQYHIFALASAKDALYSAGGAILRYDPTGRAGRSVGSELDFIVNFHLTPRQDILAAYGHLFEGSFLRNTGPGTSAETFWLMYNVRW